MILSFLLTCHLIVFIALIYTCFYSEYKDKLGLTTGGKIGITLLATLAGWAAIVFYLGFVLLDWWESND